MVALEELRPGEHVAEAVPAVVSNLEGGEVLRRGGRGRQLAADQETLVVGEVVAMGEVVAQRLGARHDPEQPGNTVGRGAVVGEDTASEEVDREPAVIVVDADDRHRPTRGVRVDDRERIHAPGGVAEQVGHAPGAGEDRLERLVREGPTVGDVDVVDDLDPGVVEGQGAGGVGDLVEFVHECLLGRGFVRVWVVVLF